MSYSSAPANIPRSSGRHTTHPCLHIRNAADAQVVFEAVRLNILPMIRCRLGPTERDVLRSGEIFVWEETDQKGGLERWTDGRRWSQSRMREPFLYYEEKEQTTKEEKEAKAARRASRNPDSPVPSSRRQDRPSKANGLTKQTYSIYVNLGQVNRKWHLVAYFSGSDYMRLPVVEDYDYLRRIRVPKGIYLSSKGLQLNSDSYADDDEDGYRSSSGPSQRPSGHREGSYVPPSHPAPHASSSRETTGYYVSQSRGGGHTSTTNTAREGSDYVNPYTHASSSSSHVRYPSSSHPPVYKSPDSKPYIPLTSEDKRALSAFRVAL
ncbi:Gti1/Pac2 family-domain-containing protein [Hysterangium stoloniferum]|nr:Gti1/Pac2 family-domain-containing protein [Hysterangium stoloniferum]